ncbi:hypothetical protein A3I57_03485 [Candidatus Beckwithbacteria bacterium RIFCSPLOWO2_02_FULL_47_23]|uniref:Uncharacterized protein n=2 Tax=Candidatus Beckwithiibacteriota TaxID=1752726 RepID=A0A1F5DVS2_9BACT|nr:MAG: hypothetical protein A3E73_00010 [Candidatus Beckwithbacteria bacterium RIFCSPHIGHO2_12_FULL_47_17]OGD59170.1 MAG: hypothetical protein A3I57_03485 [Candidatus Beckwithbacteria bacterium RIFCSPLOWO2_02_FULL_47_23]
MKVKNRVATRNITIKFFFKLFIVLVLHYFNKLLSISLILLEKRNGLSHCLVVPVALYCSQSKFLLKFGYHPKIVLF